VNPLWFAVFAATSASGPVRTTVVNVAGDLAGAHWSRAVEQAVTRAGPRLAPVDVPDEVRSALQDPFDPGADQAPARELLGIARRRYAEVAYERALEALIDAEAKARHADPTPTLWQLLTEIHLLTGIIDTARGAEVQAIGDFRIARALDPKLSLDPAYYPPAVMSRFAQAAPDAEGRGVGQLEIHDPAGAHIDIDGVAAGLAPLLRELPEGEHYIALSASGREPRIERVQVLPGKRSHVAPIFLARRPVAEEVRALVAVVRRHGKLDHDEARRLGALLGADLVLAVDAGRAQPYYVGLAALAPKAELREVKLSIPVSLESIVAALPSEPLLAAPLPPRPPGPPPRWYGRWWVWALGGVVAAGAAAATIEALSSHSTNYAIVP
jgi:hypothetical protein